MNICEGKKQSICKSTLCEQVPCDYPDCPFGIEWKQVVLSKGIKHFILYKWVMIKYWWRHKHIKKDLTKDGMALPNKIS